MATFSPDISAARGRESACQSALAIFCRAPLAGAVKTRLAATRGADFALELYRTMLSDCFDLGRALAPDAETFACFTPADAFETSELAALWEGARLPQRGADLGERMLHCLADLRAQGLERVAIIGSDAPDLPPSYLRRAFDALSARDVVVGPSDDGGFVLIGAARALPDAVFDGITWSRDDVCARLLRNLAAQGLSVAQLASWRDVDEAADVEALRARLRADDGQTAPATRALLGENRGR